MRITVEATDPSESQAVRYVVELLESNTTGDTLIVAVDPYATS